jgi:hypothetical protein
LNAEIFVGIDRLAGLLRLNFEFFLIAFLGIGDRTKGTVGSCIVVEVLFIEFIDGFWNVVVNFSELLLSELLLKNDGDDMIIDIEAKFECICIESLYLLFY